MTALRALDSLTETTGKTRGRLWQHRGIFDALDAFTSEIRRMSGIRR